jgi:hypothetical protein
VAAVVGLVVAVAALGGGVDAAVISEAPKSLSYRLEYWVGTWQVIREHPLLGVGPGNFRPHYLRHKLPGASEEILDPHNAPLDLWVSGGLLALLGAIAAVVLAARRWSLHVPTDPDATASNATPVAAGWTALEIGAACGFVLAMAARFLLEADTDPLPLGLLMGWLAVRWLFDPFVRRGDVPGAAAAAGAVALLVHLLGAGGIEMPAIVQTLLVLAVVGCAHGWRAWSARWGVVAVGGVGSLLLILCVLTGTRPVLTSRGLLDAGDAALLQDRNATAALRFYADAAEADPLNPEPPLRQAELMFQRWQADPQTNDQDFWRAVQFMRQAIERDPHSPFVYRRLGEWQMARHAVTGEPDSARAAARAFTAAVDRYPHLPALRAERALALDAAGKPQDAAAEARIALRLDEINRRRGHRDKELSPAIRVGLRRVLAGAG